MYYKKGVYTRLYKHKRDGTYFIHFFLYDINNKKSNPKRLLTIKYISSHIQPIFSGLIYVHIDTNINNMYKHASNLHLIMYGTILCLQIN